MEEANPDDLYQIIEEIGRGQFGKVFKGMKRDSGEIVAIKALPLDPDADDSTFRTIAKEIQMLKDCDHPNIVSFYGSYVKENELWIVMEFCDSDSPAKIMTRMGKPLEEPQIAACCYQALMGLDYLAKSKKIHRDIKADNVLLKSTGEAKLADLGVAAQLKNTADFHKTATGTPYWMAPELVNEENYNHKVDVWSLGITAIELAERKPPLFEHLPMRALFIIAQNNNPPPTLSKPQNWSPEFNDFVSKCLVKNPNDRLSAAQLLEHPFIKNVKATSKAILMDLVEEYHQLLDEKKKNRDQKKPEPSNAEELQNNKSQDKKPMLDRRPKRCYVSPLCAACSTECETEPWNGKWRAPINEVAFKRSNSESNLKSSQQGQPKVSVTKISELIQLMKDKQQGIPLRTHKYKKVQYPKSFRGSECVEWMLSVVGFRRSSAIYMAETLMNRGIIEHVTHSEPFLDSKSSLYRFRSKKSRKVNTWFPDDKMTQLIERMRLELEITTHKVKFQKHKNCFKGSDLVDWLVNKLKLQSRQEAVSFGQELMARSVFHHVTFSEPFEDKSQSLYRFYKDERKYMNPSPSLTDQERQRTVSGRDLRLLGGQ